MRYVLRESKIEGKKAEIEKTEQDAASASVSKKNKDDKKINKQEKSIINKQRGCMESWLKKREVNKEKVIKEKVSTEKNTENTERSTEAEKEKKVQKLAEVYGGTQATVRERSERERAELEKIREKKERSKKVKEKRELFERISERKKIEAENDKIKNRKVLKTESDGGGSESVDIKKVKLTVTAHSSEIKNKGVEIDTNLPEGNGKIDTNLQCTNTCVTEGVTSFTRLNLALEGPPKHQTRRHLPCVFDTREGVGETDGDKRRVEPSTQPGGGKIS